MISLRNVITTSYYMTPIHYQSTLGGCVGRERSDHTHSVGTDSI